MNLVSAQSPFTQKVIQVIQSIPKGKVVSYGQVAAYIGIPRAARQVGWILRSLEEGVSMPWWRVVNNTGRISIEGNLHNDKELQKKLLQQEGVAVNDDYILNIEKYRFIADNELLVKWQLPKEYREKILEKYGL
jgi:methylated-DNA-protein-cysteine methyltransferase-like protein